jgi:hypothetical protein
MFILSKSEVNICIDTIKNSKNYRLDAGQRFHTRNNTLNLLKHLLKTIFIMETLRDGENNSRIISRREGWTRRGYCLRS